MQPCRSPVLFALLLTCTSVAAAESLWERLRVHGFASQAAIRTTDNRWFGNSTTTSFGFTEIGLNASFQADPKLMLAAQVLSRRAGDLSDGSPELDYGLADVTPIATPEGRVGLRLGRIKNPLGIYNETRDVPFTHPGIFLPQVVYFDRVRNLILSTDAAMLYADRYGDAGSFSATVANGWPVLDDNVEWTYLDGDFPGEVKSNGPGWIASLWYSDPRERIKLGLSGAKLSLEFRPDTNALATLDRGTTDVGYGVASAQYNTEKWTLTAEYALTELDWRRYGPSFPDRKFTSEGWYLQGTYRLRPDLELMLRYEEGYSDRSDRDGSKIERATGGRVPANTRFSKIIDAGIRWDINRQWMVRAEYAYNNGTFILSSRENRDFSSTAPFWHLFSVQAAFRF